MINQKDNSQTSIIERATDYEPPRTLRSFFIGRPLSTADASHQTIGKIVGLAVFASDALSSTAYATQEILGVIAGAGMIAYGYLFPISLAIITLLAIVTISYEQTIHAYPGGGGAYIVARDNLGEMPAQTAGAALLTDYILTVSVSISAGVAQIVSAYPGLFPYRVFYHVDQPEGCERIWNSVCHSNLFFCDHDDKHSWLWNIPLFQRITGDGNRSATF